MHSKCLKRYCLSCVCVDLIWVDYDYLLRRIFFPKCLTPFPEYRLLDFDLCAMTDDSHNQNRGSRHVGRRMLPTNIVGTYCQRADLAHVLFVTVEDMLCFC